MKKYIILISVLMLLLVGCGTPQLSPKLYTNPEDILFQYYGNYYPFGFKLATFSPVYFGILAVVGDELIFQVTGVSSQKMKWISPIKIHKKEIMKIELSDNKGFHNKAFTVKTMTNDYLFYYSKNGDEIYEIITNWHKIDNN